MATDPDHLELITLLAGRMVEQKHAEINIQSTLSRREALQDADYVIIMIQVVGLAMYEADVNMRLRYGIDQTVGDTL